MFRSVSVNVPLPGTYCTAAMVWAVSLVNSTVFVDPSTCSWRSDIVGSLWQLSYWHPVYAAVGTKPQVSTQNESVSELSSYIDCCWSRLWCLLFAKTNSKEEVVIFILQFLTSWTTLHTIPYLKWSPGECFILHVVVSSCVPHETFYCSM